MFLKLFIVAVSVLLYKPTEKLCVKAVSVKENL